MAAAADGSSGPALAVVVATRDRPGRLRRLLAALAAQRGPGFEVVVADDGSADDTARLLRDGVPELELSWRRLEPPRGPAAARNAGWRASAAPLIAFTDDDCVPAPDWVAALAAAHRRRPEALLQGRTEPDPGEAHVLGAFSRSQRVTRLGPHFQACNVAYPRTLLERLGGFDERFGHYGEDADLAWRARESGAPALFVPDALVHHAVRNVGALALLRDSARWADAVRAYKRHPGIRESFELGVFWRPAHSRLLLAAAGVAAARRTRGASLALAVPYVGFKRRRHGTLAGTLVALPAHVAIDMAEVAAMARGSVRFRTLVL